MFVTDNAFKVILPNINSKTEVSSKPSSHEEKIMQLFAEQETVTRREVEELLSVSQASAARILRGMVENGKLIKVGSGRKLRYEKKSSSL